MAELADARGLGPRPFGGGGSSPLARTRPARKTTTAVATASLVAGVILWATTVNTGPASAAVTPTGTQVPFEEFVNDGAGGHLWNEYDQTQYASGPQIDGRASPVNFGPSELQVFTLGADNHLVDWVNDGLWGRTWNAYDLSASAGGGGAIVGSPAAIVVGSVVHVYVEATGGDLVEYVNDGQGGNLWNVHDLSTGAGNGGPIDGDPAVLNQAGVLQVLVRSGNGDLVEYASDGKSGHSWNLYDLSATPNGGGITGDPAAVLYQGTVVHAYVRSSGGQLMEYVDDNAGGHLWNAYDLTGDAGGGVQMTGDPASALLGTAVSIYVRSSSGDLVEFVNDGQDGHLWNAYDLTGDAGGGVAMIGLPAAVLYGTVAHVYVRSLADHLVEYVNDNQRGHPWNAYDLSQYSGGGTTIGSDPSALVYRGTVVHVYVGGPSPGLPDAIVQLAESQDQFNGAVVENPPDTNCNGYTAFFGRGTATGCAPGTASEEWCSDFAQWVWVLNGVNTTGINGYAFTWVGWGQAHGIFLPGATNDPRPGDAVVWGSMAKGYSPHVGLVVGVKDGNIDMVSGNSGPVDAQGDNVSVWESGYFDPAASNDGGYPILGYVVP